MELRQLRYFVTLAEELHFGRAAAREHIVQSALSQRLQRLERELGVTLMDRTTHHVRLTAAGAVFLIDARQILAHVERATVAAQRASRSRPSLRVGVADAGTTPCRWSFTTSRASTSTWRSTKSGSVYRAVPTTGGRAARRRRRTGLAGPTSGGLRAVPAGRARVLVAAGHAFAARSDVSTTLATLATAANRTETPALVDGDER